MGESSGGGVEMDGPLELHTTQFFEAPPGATLAEYIPLELQDRTVVLLNGVLVNDLHSVVARDGDVLTIAAVPAGGDRGKSIIASLAVIAISIAAGPMSLAILGAAAKGTMAAMAVQAGITLVGSLAVSALIRPPSISAPISRTQSRSQQQEETQVYAIQGQSNASRLYGRVARLYGEHKIFPSLACTPRVDTVGTKSRITALYDFGIGDVMLDDLRIGEIPIETFDPIIRIHQNSFCTNLQLVSKQVAVDQLSYTLSKGDPVLLSSKPDTSTATLEVYFPRGLVRYDASGTRKNNSVGFLTEYRLAGTSTWKRAPASWYVGAKIGSDQFSQDIEYSYSPAVGPDSKGTRWQVSTKATKSDGIRNNVTIYRNGAIIGSLGPYYDENPPTTTTINGMPYSQGAVRDTLAEDERSYVMSELVVPVPIPSTSVSVTGATNEPFVLAIKLQFSPAGVYDIRLQRTTAVNAEPTLQDDTILTAVKSYKNGPVVNLDRRHTMMELEVDASDKLSGVISNLSALGSARVRSCTASGWGPVIETSNNALIALDIIAGSGNNNPLRTDQIDFASFYKLYQICNQNKETKFNGRTYTQKRYTWNGIFDTSYTVQEAADAVLSVARAQLAIKSNGKFGVLIDEAQTVPRQLITPANSWGFSGTRTFTQIPHAIRVSFISPELGWQPSEVLVYNDGYSAANATIFDDLATFGITNAPDAWRYGRFMLAQGIFRSEQFTVTLDVENLVVQRGDLIELQHDVPLWGGLSARVVSVNGNEIHLDQAFMIAGGVGQGGYTARQSVDGLVWSGDILSSTESSITIDNPKNLAPGDLVAIGDRSYSTRQCLVLYVEPGSDLTATLTLTVYEPGVYKADEGELPPWDPGFDDSIIDAVSLKAINPKASQGWTYNVTNDPIAVVTLTWDITGRSGYTSGIIMATLGNQQPVTVGQVFDGVTTFHHHLHIVDDAEYWVGPIKYEIIPLSGLGVRGTSATVSITLKVYDIRPAPPTNCFLDVQTDTLVIRWAYSVSPDVIRYVIRYTPELNNPLWAEAQHLARVSSNVNKLSTGARTGTYLLRAQNSSGIMSDIVYLRTTIEKLPDINIVSTINDSAEAPYWDGDAHYFIPGAPLEYIPILLVVGFRIECVIPEGWLETIMLADKVTHLPLEILAPTDPRILTTTEDWPYLDELAIYNVSEVIDLGAIYEVMISDLSKSAGLTDDQFFAVATGSASLEEVDQDNELTWDCWLEYSVVDSVSFMSSWVTLSSIDPISQGNSDWSEWRKIRVGYATGHRFRFRFVASAVEAIRVSVFDGTIVLDMPDRTWKANNVPVVAGGTTINFDPAFNSKPILAVTIQGTTAVSYQVTALTRTAVTLKLLNSAGVAVAGTIDIAALGYGRERAQVI